MPKKDSFEAFTNNTFFAFTVAQEKYHAKNPSREILEVKTKTIHLPQTGLLQINFEVEYLDFKILLSVRARKKWYRNKFDITVTVSIRAAEFLERNTYRTIMVSLPLLPGEYKLMGHILGRAYEFGILTAEINSYQPQSVEDHINYFLKSALPSIFDETGNIRLVQPRTRDSS